MTPEMIENRIQEGIVAAQGNSDHSLKPFGDTSPENYPYTYWWVKGYNDEKSKGAT